MRLTIWQFLGILGALIGGYLVWSMWGSKLNQNAMIHNMNNSIQGDDDRAKVTSDSTGDGSGGTKTPSPW